MECDILDVISHVVISAVKECINVKNICGNLVTPLEYSFVLFPILYIIRAVGTQK